MTKRAYPLSKVYGLLEPGPVVLVTTQYKRRSNIMTMSWHTMLEFDPALIGCVISDRNYSFNLLMKTKQCVINIPTRKLAKAVVGCGNTTGAKVDKFKIFQLTPKAASRVKAPLIDECYANLECRIINTQLVKKYCLFILKVQKAWIDPKVKNARTIHHLGKGNFMVAGERFKLPSRMK